MVVQVSTILLEDSSTEPFAIPIPAKSQGAGITAANTTSSTTPSLQSILDQRKCSQLCLRDHSVSSNDTLNSSAISCSSSLFTVSSSEMESCESHPLECPISCMDDVEEEFFVSSKVQLIMPLSTRGAEPSLTKRASFVSNLTRSIKSLTNSTSTVTHKSNDLLFGIQPRLTDDRHPLRLLEDNFTQELETYKVTSQPSSSSDSITVHRAREARINSKFLRLYAHEASARENNLLPEISQDEENRFLEDPAYFRGSDREFALVVRQRLWSCVVLPPREDPAFEHAPEYIQVDKNCTGSMTSLKATNAKKPWVKFEDERNGDLGPRGVLGKGTQFVVKGWCNSRWLASQ